jgi:hypothetical protein
MSVEVLHNVFADLKPHIRPDVGREAVMEAGPDTSICNLFGKGRHVGPTVGYAGCHRAGYRDLGDVLGSERRLDDTRDGTAQDAVRARVFRVHRRVVDRLPSRLTVGGRVAIVIAVANCRDGPPEVVMVLSVEHSYERVVEPNRHERHQPSAVADTHLFCGHELAHERMICRWTDHKPETGSLGLLGRPLGTGLSTIAGPARKRGTRE